MTLANNHHVTSHYIDGIWVAGKGDDFTSTNPANGEHIWLGRNATSDEISSAVDSAHKAFRSWSTIPLSERLQHIEAFANIVAKEQTTLANLISEETGKPLWESITEVSAVIGKVKLSIDAYYSRTSEKQVKIPDAKGFCRFKPHGVVAVLGPFNFPAHLSNGHIIPALIAGNTIVYKPSELTPAVAQLILKCWEKANLPAGVLNCIQGGTASAQQLLKQDIQGVYFTGSYATGLKINQAFSHRPEVILALEMGGNNPLIIDSIQNRPAAVYQSILSSFISAGQRCTCARKLLIPHGEEGNSFLEAFIHASKQIKVGAYTDRPEPFMGSIIHHQHALSHLSAQQKLLKLGGEALLPMQLLVDNTGLLSPGIIEMTHAPQKTDDEIFAPLVQIYRYDDLNQAIDIANDTAYGLAAGILTDSEYNYQHFYQNIRAGIVNWNRPTTGAASSLPFGGVGKSGNHRPSAYFAADYCAYPVASLEQPELSLPATTLPGIILP